MTQLGQPPWCLPTRANPNHVPKGPKGGQFAPKAGMAVEAIKVGQRLDFATGIEHASGELVKDFRGAVARKATDGRLMVNAGTKKRPRWVVTDAKHASEPSRKSGPRNDNRRDYMKSLTADELKAIDNYQLEGYKTINGTLRQGDVPSAVTARRVAHLDAAVAKGVLAQATTLYRSGGGFDPAAMVGHTFIDHGFVSTSERTDLPLKMAAGRRGGVYMRIKASAGASVGYLSKVRNQQAVSKYDGVLEQEALLPRGSRFKVTAARMGADGMWTVDMDLLT